MGLVDLTLSSKKLGLAVFISGRGSNLQSIIDACRIDDFPAKIKVVVSDVEEAYGLTRAKSADIPTRFVSRKNYGTKGEFEAAILENVKEFSVDMICLAGFMRILSADFLGQWNKPIINIHPSLLPKHKGLDTHQRAIDAGDTESGCTVHHVTAGVDEGELILQKKVPILNSETAEVLAARVLAVEHEAYPEAIRIMAKKLLYTQF
jgi:phosphoribosylglycinamide formyltransferase-1